MTEPTRSRGGAGETIRVLRQAHFAAMERAEKAEAEADRRTREVGMTCLVQQRLSARVRELEEGLRALRLAAQRWDDSFDGEIVAGIDALLAPKQEGE